MHVIDTCHSKLLPKYGLSSLFCDNQPDNQCSENNIMWGVQHVMTPKYFSEDIIFLFKVITCWI